MNNLKSLEIELRIKNKEFQNRKTTFEVLEILKSKITDTEKQILEELGGFYNAGWLYFSRYITFSI